MGKNHAAAHDVSGSQPRVWRCAVARDAGRPFLLARFLRALFLGFGLLPFAGCSRGDSDCLARIARKVSCRVGDATAEIKNSLGTGWQDVGGELGVEARVTARLRWDKALADAAIEVKLHDGEIELTGVVKDEAQRQRAIEIAGSTSGVEKVADQLQIQVAEPH
ncbi:MAG: BON domain-containing protein [Planctomycetes bacterium]|nr:BON domain-containing protein [Planctomycetota bacterium]